MATAPASRTLALSGLIGMLAAPVLIGLLHVIPPTGEINPIRRTISEYALHDTGWIFDLAVLALAGGSAAVLVSLIGTRLVRSTSIGSLALLLWSAALAAVVLFPKHNWSVGPSANGSIHRVASVVAFLSLPIAALAISAAYRNHERWRSHARWVFNLGVLSLLAFSPILIAVLSEPVTGVRWFRAIPLGAVERILAFTEVVTVVALGWWAARAAAPARSSAPEPPVYSLDAPA